MLPAYNPSQLALVPWRPPHNHHGTHPTSSSHLYLRLPSGFAPHRDGQSGQASSRPRQDQRDDSPPNFILNRSFGRLIASPLEIHSWIYYPSQLVEAFIEETERLAMPRATHDTSTPVLAVADSPCTSKKRKLDHVDEDGGWMEGKERSDMRPSSSWALIKRPKLTVAAIPQRHPHHSANTPGLCFSHRTLSLPSFPGGLPPFIFNRAHWKTWTHEPALGSHISIRPKPTSHPFLHPCAHLTSSHILSSYSASTSQISLTPSYRSGRLITDFAHWRPLSFLKRPEDENRRVAGPAVASSASIDTYHASDATLRTSDACAGPDRQEQAVYADDDYCMAAMDSYDPMCNISTDCQSPPSSDGPSHYQDVGPPASDTPGKRSLESRTVLSPKPSDNNDDIFSASLFESGQKRQKLNNSDDREGPGAGQWRVGKTPGHQGSHSRSVKGLAGEEVGEFSAGHKRSLSQSTTRVLKKPFKPPTRIVLPKKPPMLSSPHLKVHQSSSSTCEPSTPGSSSSRTAVLDTPARNIKQTPPATDIRSAKLARPFKTPLRSSRSNAPSPATVMRVAPPSSPFSPVPPQTGQAALTALQNEAHMLKKAIRYDSEDSAGRLKELVTTWKAAGREMVERLYDLVPRPDPGTMSDNPYISKPASSSYWQESSESTVFTSEQEDLLAKAPRNKDGYLVDEDGNLLIPDVVDQDVGALMKELNSSVHYGDSGKRLGGNGRDQGEEIMSHSRNDSNVDPTAWNYGTVMRGLGVDPPLFGWDDEAEDWDYVVIQ
ncbi:hypothetical protein IAR50_005155 [Cryptococcus sp. DSM 104548]